MAIAGARLGFRPVLGLDHELESIAAARQNAAANAAEIDVRRFDLRADTLPWIESAPPSMGAQVVVANLLRPLLIELAAAMPAAPAHLLAGGLLTGEVDEVSRVFGERLQLHERERRESEGWAAVWLSRRRSAAIR